MLEEACSWGRSRWQGKEGQGVRLVLTTSLQCCLSAAHRCRRPRGLGICLDVLLTT